MRLLARENGGCWRKVGEGWAKWVGGIQEVTCDERRVLHVSDESLHSPPETNTTLYKN